MAAASALRLAARARIAHTCCEPRVREPRRSGVVRREVPMIKGVAAVWLPVTDMDRALQFYGETLGLRETERDSDWSAFDANGLMIGLNGSKEESPHGDGGALVAFQPEGELEAEVERLRGVGVEFPDGISEHPWGRIVPFKDPDGNDLQLYSPPR